MPDSLRAGRWSLERRLGEGSQGTTWAAVGPDGRSVAVKRFDVRGARAWKDVELAEREARVLAQLSHPNLPAYVEHFEEDGSLFLVMEKIEGESLAALRKRGGSLSRAEVLRFLSDASDILDYLHGRAPPVIHRDLKPGNVLRRPDGSYAFVDFGAVRDRMRPEGGSTVVGTFGYMAPEQFQGRALPASDVYAVGATALTLLTGVEPEAQPHKGLSIDVRAALGPRADEPLIGLLTRMLEPDPDQRPSRIRPLLEPFRDAPKAAAANPPPPRESGFLEDLGQKIGREIEREIGERLSQHRGEAERFRAKTEQWMDKAARQIERKVERRRERDQRRAEREQRRAERDQRRAGAFPSPLDEATRAATREARAAQRARDWSSPPPPWMGGFLGFHALQIVRLFLLFLLLVIPTVVLSVMGLRKAVVAVRDWHRDVVDAELQAAQRWLRGGYVAARAEELHEEPRVRVREVPPDPLRVAPSDTAGDERATDEDASRPAAKRRKV